jgi:hypothetical protein
MDGVDYVIIHHPVLNCSIGYQFILDAWHVNGSFEESCKVAEARLLAEIPGLLDSIGIKPKFTMETVE